MEPREIILGLISLLVGSLMTYSVKAVALEGRMGAIESSLVRIESRLYGAEIIKPEASQRNDRPAYRPSPR